MWTHRRLLQGFFSLCSPFSLTIPLYRCYNLGDPLQRNEFIEDFKISAVISILVEVRTLPSLLLTDLYLPLRQYLTSFLPVDAADPIPNQLSPRDDNDSQLHLSAFLLSQHAATQIHRPLSLLQVTC
jgi:hypothetical protein